MSFINVLLQLASGSVAPVGGGPTGKPLLMVWGRESNSGGQVPTSECTTLETTVNPAVQILDPVNLDGFEDLHIGVNNNRKHTYLTPLVNVGWHIGVGNRMREGTFVPAPLYLAEGGHGGSVISEWKYNNSFYYPELVLRIDTARENIFELTGEYPDMVFLDTFGINDALAGTAVSTFTALNIEFWEQLRLLYGNFPIIGTTLPLGFDANEPAYNAEIATYPTVIPNYHLVNASDLPMISGDLKHWSYAGMKTLANRLMDKYLELIAV